MVSVWLAPIAQPTRGLLGLIFHK